jgi:VanZ family protein
MYRRHKLFTWSRVRTVYLLTSVLSFALTEIGRDVYRPFVYRTGLNDLGVADTMGNHIGAVALVFFILTLMNATRQEALIVIAVVTIGYVVYEFAQYFLPGSVVDVKDAVASIVGGVLSLLVFIVVYRVAGRRENT